MSKCKLYYSQCYKCEIGIMRFQNLLTLGAFHGIFEYISNDIRLFIPKIFEYLCLIHFIIMNIFLFAFDPEMYPKYISICVFGPIKSIRIALS